MGVCIVRYSREDSPYPDRTPALTASGRYISFIICHYLLLIFTYRIFPVTEDATDGRAQISQADKAQDSPLATHCYDG